MSTLTQVLFSKLCDHNTIFTGSSSSTQQAPQDEDARQVNQAFRQVQRRGMSVYPEDVRTEIGQVVLKFLQWRHKVTIQVRGKHFSKSECLDRPINQKTVYRRLNTEKDLPFIFGEGSRAELLRRAKTIVD